MRAFSSLQAGVRRLCAALLGAVALLVASPSGAVVLDEIGRGTASVHRLKFFVDPQLAAEIGGAEAGRRLAQYVADVNTVFTRESVRGFGLRPRRRPAMDRAGPGTAVQPQRPGQWRDRGLHQQVDARLQPWRPDDELDLSGARRDLEPQLDRDPRPAAPHARHRARRRRIDREGLPRAPAQDPAARARARVRRRLGRVLQRDRRGRHHRRRAPRPTSTSRSPPTATGGRASTGGSIRCWARCSRSASTPRPTASPRSR